MTQRDLRLGEMRFGRRQALRILGGSAFAASVAGLLAACALPAPQPGVLLASKRVDQGSRIIEARLGERLPRPMDGSRLLVASTATYGWLAEADDPFEARARRRAVLDELLAQVCPQNRLTLEEAILAPVGSVYDNYRFRCLPPG